MRRALAILLGVVLVLIALVTRSSLPAGYQLSRTMTFLGAGATISVMLTMAARRGTTARLRSVVGAACAGAIVAAAVVNAAVGLSPCRLGRGSASGS